LDGVGRGEGLAEGYVDRAGGRGRVVDGDGLAGNAQRIGRPNGGAAVRVSNLDGDRETAGLRRRAGEDAGGRQGDTGWQRAAVERERHRRNDITGGEGLAEGDVHRTGVGGRIRDRDRLAVDGQVVRRTDGRAAAHIRHLDRDREDAVSRGRTGENARRRIERQARRQRARVDREADRRSTAVLRKGLAER